MIKDFKSYLLVGVSMVALLGSITLLLISLKGYCIESSVYNPPSRMGIQRFSVESCYLCAMDGVVSFQYGIMPPIGNQLSDDLEKKVRDLFPEGKRWRWREEFSIESAWNGWERWIPWRTTLGVLTTYSLPIVPIIVLSLLLPLRAVLLKCRRRFRRKRHQCTGCGYDLTGLSEPRCPECGSPAERHVTV